MHGSRQQTPVPAYHESTIQSLDPAVSYLSRIPLKSRHVIHIAAVTQLQFYGQDWGIQLPSQVLAMAPYLATIIALVLISRDVTLTKANAPAAIGSRGEGV